MTNNNLGINSHTDFYNKLNKNSKKRNDILKYVNTDKTGEIYGDSNQYTPQIVWLEGHENAIGKTFEGPHKEKMVRLLCNEDVGPKLVTKFRGVNYHNGNENEEILFYSTNNRFSGFNVEPLSIQNYSFVEVPEKLVPEVEKIIKYTKA